MKSVKPAPNDDVTGRVSPAATGRSPMMDFAGLAFRYLVILGLTSWLGLRMDKWLAWRFPLFVWALPLVAVVGLLVKAVIDTSDTSDTSDKSSGA